MVRERREFCLGGREPAWDFDRGAAASATPDEETRRIPVPKFVQAASSGHEPVILLNHSSGMIGEKSSHSSTIFVPTFSTIRGLWQRRPQVCDKAHPNPAMCNPAILPELLRHASQLLKLCCRQSPGRSFSMGSWPGMAGHHAIASSHVLTTVGRYFCRGKRRSGAILPRHSGPAIRRPAFQLMTVQITNTSLFVSLGWGQRVSRSTKKSRVPT